MENRHETTLVISPDERLSPQMLRTLAHDLSDWVTAHGCVCWISRRPLQDMRSGRYPRPVPVFRDDAIQGLQGVIVCLDQRHLRYESAIRMLQRWSVAGLLRFQIVDRSIDRAVI